VAALVSALTPYDWQQDDINRLLDHDATGFVVAETGAGKSLIATEVGIESGVDTRLVIAPQGTHKRVWLQGIANQDPGAVVRRIDGSAKGKDAMNALEWGEPGWYVMTPQLFTRWDLPTADVRPDFTIVDEAHLLSNRQAQGSKVLRRLKSGHRIVMSGTMVRNKVENFWPLLRWVYPDMNGERALADSNYERWVLEWMATKWDRFAPRNYVVVGERFPGRIAETVPCYVQHFKRAECCFYHPEGFLEGLPEPVQITETVTLLPEQKRLIARMEKDYIAWLEDTANGDVRAAVASLPIVARTRLRQMTLAVPSFLPGSDGLPEIDYAPDAASPKYEALLDIVARVAEPVVAATSSQKYARYVTNRLQRDGLRAFEWSGAVSQRVRDEALEEFRRGGYDVVVGVTEAIGTGIDGLQDASGVLVSLERSDDLTANIQLEGRLDRRGQAREGGVLHYEIVAEDSMDEGIISRQLERRLDINRSLRRRIAA
jgi:hypothetical protein